MHDGLDFPDFVSQLGKTKSGKPGFEAICMTLQSTDTSTQAFVTLCKLHAAHEHLMLVQFLLLFPGESSGIIGLLCRVLAQLLFQSLHI